MSLARALATAIPLLGVALLVGLLASGSHVENPKSHFMITLSLAALCVVGLGGIGVAYILEKQTRADIAALVDMPSSHDLG